MIIDATNTILGRLGTVVAKKLLMGEDVQIINCDKAIISGAKKKVLADYKKKFDRKVHAKGPFIPKTADRFVKRTIRGMIPYKRPRGAEAFKNLKCYIGVPSSFQNKKLVLIDNANVSKIPNLKYISVGEIVKFLGGKL